VGKSGLQNGIRRIHRAACVASSRFCANVPAALRSFHHTWSAVRHFHMSVIIVL
jgi:hypothetical protein